MDIYREELLEHYHHPQGWGLKKWGDFQARRRNPSCGDDITVQLDVSDGKVMAMRFEGHGCVISRAAASYLSEAIVGCTLAEVESLSQAQVEEWLNIKLPPARITCGLLAVEASQEALRAK